MNETFDFFFSLIVLIILLGLSYMFGANECHKKFHGFEETRYSVVEGCMVKYQNQWFPSETIVVEAK